MAIERFIIRPIGHRSPFAVVVAAIGLFLGLNALAPFIWKVTNPEAFDVAVPERRRRLRPHRRRRVAQREHRRARRARWSPSALLVLLFQKTKFGLAMRAVASNPESAPLVGIKTGQVLVVSWGLAAVVGAIGGALVGSLRGNVDAVDDVHDLLLGHRGGDARRLRQPASAPWSPASLLGVFETMVGRLPARPRSARSSRAS